jgi:hypothetical protein
MQRGGPSSTPTTSSSSCPAAEDEKTQRNNEQRQALLVELAQAVAARPFSLDRALSACHAIEVSLGVECSIEAVAVAAAFELNTKAADMTGKAPFDRVTLRVLYLVLLLVQWIRNLFRFLQPRTALHGNGGRA